MEAEPTAQADEQQKVLSGYGQGLTTATPARLGITVTSDG